jgi:hypothetical protein
MASPLSVNHARHRSLRARGGHLFGTTVRATADVCNRAGDIMGCTPDETLRHLKRAVRKLGELKVAVRGAELRTALRASCCAWKRAGRPPHVQLRICSPSQNAMALPGIRDDGIVTVGMQVADADWERGWKRHLTKAYKKLPGTEGRFAGCAEATSCPQEHAHAGPPHPPAAPLSRSAALPPPAAGWADDTVVSVYLLCIKDAAAPDKQGLLQAVLRRWQAGVLPVTVFALPAVQVGGDGGR